MTIAMCYVSPEGVVLGADSTSSHITHPGIFHYFNHNQKLFEVGENSTIGMLTWGLGGVGASSHRSLLSRLADDLKISPPADLNDVVTRWGVLFGSIYNSEPEIARVCAFCRAASHKAAFGAMPPGGGVRTEEEERQLTQALETLSVGFCFAGYVLPDRTPAALYLAFGPLNTAPAPQVIPMLSYAFWGVPNMIKRLIWGYDEALEATLLNSGKWSGTPDDLRSLLNRRRLNQAILPIRDVVDFVHTCIYSTIKALKFSTMPQVCGGPIEIAVITTDRPFRWVRHKPWDAAIMEGALT